MRSVPGTLILLSAVIVKADTVLEWNIVALKTTSAAPFNPPVESRSLAIVHAAMFDAINSIIGEFRPYAVELRRREHRPTPPLLRHTSRSYDCIPLSRRP
jgi:hypothetical protein